MTRTEVARLEQLANEADNAQYAATEAYHEAVDELHDVAALGDLSDFEAILEKVRAAHAAEAKASTRAEAAEAEWVEAKAALSAQEAHAS